MVNQGLNEDIHVHGVSEYHQEVLRIGKIRTHSYQLEINCNTTRKRLHTCASPEWFNNNTLSSSSCGINDLYRCRLQWNDIVWGRLLMGERIEERQNNAFRGTDADTYQISRTTSSGCNREQVRSPARMGDHPHFATCLVLQLGLNNSTARCLPTANFPHSSGVKTGT